MKNGILAAVKGGYDKKDVLEKIDAFMSLVMKIQKGTSSAEAKEELIKIKNMPLREVDENTEGFSKFDTNGYFTQLEHNVVAYFKQP